MHRKNLPRVWPRPRLGLDARAIVVESEHSGWLLSQPSQSLFSAKKGEIIVTDDGKLRMGPCGFIYIRTPF